MHSYFIFIIVAIIFVQLIFLENIIAKIILLVLAVFITFFLIKKVLMTSKRFKIEDPDTKLVKLNLDALNNDQKKIYEEYGNPINIIKEEAIEFNIYLWIYKKQIIKFDEKGNLIKIM